MNGMDRGARVAAICLVLVAGAGAVQASDVTSEDGAVRVARMGPDGSALIHVSSKDGWTCEVSYAAPGRDGSMVRFPLVCTDAVEGEAIMSVDGATGRAALVFDRDDGYRGSATFAMR